MERIHLSGSAIIKDNKVLLLFKKKHSYYEFPGGKVENGESWEDTAIRETKEEIGCDIELIKLLSNIDFEVNGRYFTSHKYQVKIKNNKMPKIMEPEIFRDLIWMPIEDYGKYPIAPNVRIFCEDYLNGKIKFSF